MRIKAEIVTKSARYADYSPASARRKLFDLSNILEHLPQERWDDLGERDAVLRGLGTWVEVLREIARENIEE